MSTTFISSSSSSFSFRSAVLCKIFTDELSPMKCAMKSYKGQYCGSPVVSLIMADRYTAMTGPTPLLRADGCFYFVCLVLLIL